MPDSNSSIESLLTELVELQKVANAQQMRAIENSERFYAEARERTESSIALQKTAVAKQGLFVRVWLGLILFVFIALFAAVAMLLHHR